MSEHDKKESETITITIPKKIEVSNIPIDKNEKPWMSDNEYTKEYKDFIYELDIIVNYIGLRMTQIPELKENTLKRALTFESIIKLIALKVQISGMHYSSILQTLLAEYYYAININKEMYQYAKE
jgi:hypothetical protein